jgi:hypothetical protein
LSADVVEDVEERALGGAAEQAKIPGIFPAGFISTKNDFLYGPT